MHIDPTWSSRGRCIIHAAAALAGTAAAMGAVPFGAVVELSGLNGANGFTIEGVDALDFAGRSVSSAGDVNGDGIDDLIIGAPAADPDNVSGAGESYIIFGQPGLGATGTLDPSQLDGSDGFTIQGIASGDSSGFSVASAGDVNGDGHDDIIIGAPDAESGPSLSGESYVVFGGPAPHPPTVALSGLSGADGFRIIGEAGDRNGGSVASAGDVNGDGFADIVVGARGASYGTGSASIMFGGPGPFQAYNFSFFNGYNGFSILGENAGDLSASDVSSAGDINGDGFDDVIVGAPGADADSGRAYVVFGGPVPFPTGLWLATLDGDNGFIIESHPATLACGASVSPAGDVNGDGFDDIIIGAPDTAGLTGEAHVVFGSLTIGAAGALDLAALDGADGFTIHGIGAYDSTGFSVSAAGDVNADGHQDLAIGAPGADPGARTDGGATYILFGGPSVGASGIVSLAALNGDDGFVIHGIDPSDASGFSVSSAGDVNGDGIADIIIGAFSADPDGRNSAGESYVVFGRAPAPSCAGDITGDGLVNTGDFNVFATNFGSGPGATAAQGDLTGDGFVNTADFNILAGDFGCSN